MKRLIFAMFAVSLGGCASVDKGLKAMDAGDCKAAFHNWIGLARGGDSAAQNNMGVLWTRGCPAAGIAQNYREAALWYSHAVRQNHPTAMMNLGDLYLGGAGVPQSLNEAIAFYRLSARWGHQAAHAKLTALNQPIPHADLLAAHQANRAEAARQSSDIWAVLLGAALSGAAQGYAQGQTQYSAPAYTPPKQSPKPAQQAITTSPPRQVATGECNFDVNCPAGQRCMKPQHALRGICGVAVDGLGTPNYGPASPQECRHNVECGPGFTCSKPANQFVGVCTR